MPTDADVRTPIKQADAPSSPIDAEAVIRRSRRRRLPQVLGVGSALTLAVAGIGVASFTGLQGLSPGMTAADAPAGVSEAGPAPWADSSAPTERTGSCAPDPVGEVTVQSGITVSPRFPVTVSAGQPVNGTLTFENNGTERFTSVITAPLLGLSTGAGQSWHADQAIAGSRVDLAPGESLALPFTFDAVPCS